MATAVIVRPPPARDDHVVITRHCSCLHSAIDDVRRTSMTPDGFPADQKERPSPDSRSSRLQSRLPESSSGCNGQSREPDLPRNNCSCLTWSSLNRRSKAAPCTTGGRIVESPPKIATRLRSGFTGAVNRARPTAGKAGTSTCRASTSRRSPSKIATESDIETVPGTFSVKPPIKTTCHRDYSTPKLTA